MYDEVEITADINCPNHIKDVILDGRRMDCIYASVERHPKDEYATLTLKMYVKRSVLKRRAFGSVWQVDYETTQTETT